MKIPKSYHLVIDHKKRNNEINRTKRNSIERKLFSIFKENKKITKSCFCVFRSKIWLIYFIFHYNRIAYESSEYITKLNFFVNITKPIFGRFDGRILYCYQSHFICIQMDPILHRFPSSLYF